MRSIRLTTIISALALVAAAYFFLPSVASADHCGPLRRAGGLCLSVAKAAKEVVGVERRQERRANGAGLFGRTRLADGDGRPFRKAR